MWAILGCWEQSRAPPSVAVPVTARLVDSGRGAVGTRLRPTPRLAQAATSWGRKSLGGRRGGGPLAAQPSRGQTFQCRWWGPRAATPTAALGDRRTEQHGGGDARRPTTGWGGFGGVHRRVRLAQLPSRDCGRLGSDAPSLPRPQGHQPQALLLASTFVWVVREVDRLLSVQRLLGCLS